MSTEHAAPMSAEDEYAANMAALREAESKPAEAAAPERPAAEATSEPQQGQPRDEAGRFAPKQEGAQAAPAEPWEGFSALDPVAQEKVRRIMERADKAERERNSFRDRFSRANQQLSQLSRQQSAGQGSGRQPQPVAGSGRSAQPGIAQTRADVATMAPGAERDEANRRLDAWEKYAREYPEDAAAISERLDAIRATYEGRFGEIDALRQQVNDLRGVAERFQHAETNQRAREAQSTLDDIAPHWRILAGWVDESGAEVPHEQRTWHPAMATWLDAHDPEVRAFKLQQLANPSPHVAGQVFREFQADWDAAEATGQAAPAAPAAVSRRAENLRDVAPGGGGGAPGPVWQRGMTAEDEYAATVEWMRANKR